MIHSIAIGDIINIAVNARESYSKNKLKVNAGCEYEFICNKKQKWKDWWISSDADGYNNFLALIAGLRVKKAKCFCLCGCYNDDYKTGFGIGTYKKIKATTEAIISFFANDVNGFYCNNSGVINITIKRIS